MAAAACRLNAAATACSAMPGVGSRPEARRAGPLEHVPPDRRTCLRKARTGRLIARASGAPHGGERHLADHRVFSAGGQEFRVAYLPAESDSGMFGGNSNWRGPIWMPVNALIIRALLHYYAYYGDNFKIECPTGSGRMMNLFEVAHEIADRLTRIFLRDAAGRRPVFGGNEKLQGDPHWRDHLLFYEYFHGDNGAGIGASHQTGWTGVVAALIELFGKLDPGFVLGGRPPPGGTGSVVTSDLCRQAFPRRSGRTIKGTQAFARRRGLPIPLSPAID
jgi:hypothetical protein